MTVAADASVLTIDGLSPRIDSSAFVAPGARVIGDVRLGEGSSVWYNAVLRADGDRIVIGAGSNLQDNVSVHVNPGMPAVLGRDVSVGHNAVIHGCTVEDGCLIGMGAVVLSGAVVGAGSLVAAGAVVLEHAEIPPGSLVAGVPARVRRPLTAPERERLVDNALTYRRLSAEHRAAHRAWSVGSRDASRRRVEGRTGIEPA